MNNTIIGSITSKQNLTGEISKAFEYIELKPITQEKTTIPTKETQEITYDKGYTGLSKVIVNPIPEEYIMPNGTKEIDSNGIYNVNDYENVNVNIEFKPNLQDKSITITENGTQNITCDNGYDGLNSVEVTTSVVSSGSYAPRWITFHSCELTDLDYEVASLDTSNITCMGIMFNGCSKVTSLDLRHFNTTNVDRMHSMFNGCKALTSLDLSSFDTSKVTNMYRMFYNCTSLTYLDIRNFTFDKVTSAGDMFLNVPSNCLIIVKNNAARTFIKSLYGTATTNIKTVAEL